MTSAAVIASDRPSLPRGVRLHYDAVRETPVLLGPEIALMLDPIGKAVLDEVDGVRDIAAISEDLARRYDAPRDMIEADVIEFLQGLAVRRLVDLS